MPYFLVHGATAATAEECLLIQIAPTPSDAARLVQAKGVFTSRVVQLDDGSQDALPDAGDGESDLLRLGTRLDHQGRTDEAILVMRHILREHANAEAAIRIGRYLRRAKRFDDAWRHLNMVKVSGYDRHSIERLGFHCYPDLYRELAEICESENKHKRHQFFMAVSRLIWIARSTLGTQVQKDGVKFYEVDRHSKYEWKSEAYEILAALYGSRRRAAEVLTPILRRRKREPYSWYVHRAVSMEETLASALEQ